MNSYNHLNYSQCNDECIQSNCSVCSMPIYLMDHYLLKCHCGNSLYHIECLNQQCPSCNKSFEENQLNQINFLKRKSIEKFQVFLNQQKKQQKARKDVQKKINQIILPFYSNNPNKNN